MVKDTIAGLPRQNEYIHPEGLSHLFKTGGEHHDRKEHHNQQTQQHCVILRHTYITNLLLKGVDIKTVQYLAGHERAKITLDIYAHLTYNRPEEIIEKINMAFAPGAVTGN